MENLEKYYRDWETPKESEWNFCLKCSAKGFDVFTIWSTGKKNSFFRSKTDINSGNTFLKSFASEILKLNFSTGSGFPNWIITESATKFWEKQKAGNNKIIPNKRFFLNKFRQRFIRFRLLITKRMFFVISCLTNERITKILHLHFMNLFNNLQNHLYSLFHRLNRDKFIRTVEKQTAIKYIRARQPHIR